MSSFFTLPASQKKRKRGEASGSPVPKRSRSERSGARKPPRDESISGSDSDFDEKGDDAPDGTFEGSDSEDVEEDETGAERRLKLAERYLGNLKEQVQDQIGFDAEQIDKDLIAERLKEDVAETKGRIYRFVASEFDFAHAARASFRQNSHCTTSIATCPPYVYTVTRDMTLTKWELPTPPLPPSSSKAARKPSKPIRRRPTKLLSVRGRRSGSSDPSYCGHTAAILCVVASEDGKFVVTGGDDKKLIVWNTVDLKPLRVFNQHGVQHRGPITSLAFRRGTNELYSASADRTIKTWSLNELAFSETLFGHQSEIMSVSSLSQKRCLSAGGRDRTVRLWKVDEETQLVFRGGGHRKQRTDAKGIEMPAEGSIDQVAFVDDETFLTGSDDGSIKLWSVHKKKAVFTLPLAHGRDPALRVEDVFAEMEMEGREAPAPPEARWITALKVLPYMDMVISGSWDGDIRIWQISRDRKQIEPVGVVGRIETAQTTLANGENEESQEPSLLAAGDQKQCRGVVNDIDVFERGKDGPLCIVAALGKTHSQGRWRMIEGGRNGAVVFEIPRKASSQSMTQSRS